MGSARAENPYRVLSAGAVRVEGRLPARHVSRHARSPTAPRARHGWTGATSMTSATARTAPSRPTARSRPRRSTAPSRCCRQRRRIRRCRWTAPSLSSRWTKSCSQTITTIANCRCSYQQHLSPWRSPATACRSRYWLGIGSASAQVAHGQRGGPAARKMAPRRRLALDIRVCRYRTERSPHSSGHEVGVCSRSFEDASATLRSTSRTEGHTYLTSHVV